MAKQNKLAKKYRKMQEWKKLSTDERQQIFYDHKTWNIDCKKSSDNEQQPETNKTDMNRQIKPNQDILYAIKNRLVSLPDTSYELNNNYVDNSNSIKGNKSKKIIESE